MAQIQRRKTYTAVDRRRSRRQRCTNCGAVDDQHRHRRHRRHHRQQCRPGPRRLRAGARHRQQRRRRRSRAAHRRRPRQARHARAHHRRLPLQRPHPAEEVSRVRPRAGQVPHQSRQRLHRQEGRRQLPHHDRSCHRERQAGAHRRQLGLARSAAAHADDGRELQARRTERRARRDDGSDGAKRVAFGRARRAATACARTRSSSAPRSAACRT